MTLNEFNDWLDNHKGYYPGIDAWLSKQERSKDILEAWMSNLRSVNVLDAKRASRDLYNSERQPAGYERHAAIVRKMVFELVQMRQQSKEVARFGSGAVRCRDCRDTGIVSVRLFGNLYDMECARGREHIAQQLTQSVACDCEAGARWFSAGLPDQRNKGVRLDRQAMEIVGSLVASEPATPEESMQFKEWRKTLNKFVQGPPPNFMEEKTDASSDPSR